MLAGEELTGEIRRQQAIPYGAVQSVDPIVLAEKLDPGIGYDDVQTAPARRRRIHGGRDLGLDGAVGRQDERLAARLRDLRGQGLQRLPPPGDQPDPRALGGKAERGGAADAGAGARHHRAASGEPSRLDSHRCTPFAPLARAIVPREVHCGVGRRSASFD